eukprot:7878030-Pyramimonas_sp.AAC.1
MDAASSAVMPGSRAAVDRRAAAREARWLTLRRLGPTEPGGAAEAAGRRRTRRCWRTAGTRRHADDVGRLE